MLRPPFFWTRTQPDPDGSRLFYGKSFIYPLVAAPFVKVFGTNGFLVLHALLLAGVAWCAYPVPARAVAGHARRRFSPAPSSWRPSCRCTSSGSRRSCSTSRSAVFAYFCWLYKEVASTDADAARAAVARLGPRSDLVAAMLLGIATFSKPTNALLFVPDRPLCARGVADLRPRRRAVRSVRRGVAARTLRRQHGDLRRVELPGRRSQAPSTWSSRSRRRTSTFEAVATKAAGARRCADRRHLQRVECSGRT